MDPVRVNFATLNTNGMTSGATATPREVPRACVANAEIALRNFIKNKTLTDSKNPVIVRAVWHDALTNRAFGYGHFDKMNHQSLENFFPEKFS